MITACPGSARSSDRPLRRDCPLHFPGPELWSPAANVRAGQAGAESIKRRGRRSESSVVAGALTWAHGALAPVICHQSSNNQHQFIPHPSCARYASHPIYILPAESSVRAECVIIGKFVMSNQHNYSLNFLFQVTYFLYFLPKLQW